MLSTVGRRRREPRSPISNSRRPEIVAAHDREGDILGKRARDQRGSGGKQFADLEASRLERLASRETEPVAKTEFLELARGWREVAASYEYVEKLENFLKTHKAPKGLQSAH